MTEVGCRRFRGLRGAVSRIPHSIAGNVTRNWRYGLDEGSSADVRQLPQRFVEIPASGYLNLVVLGTPLRD